MKTNKPTTKVVIDAETGEEITLTYSDIALTLAISPIESSPLGEAVSMRLTKFDQFGKLDRDQEDVRVFPNIFESTDTNALQCMQKIEQALQDYINVENI